MYISIVDEHWDMAKADTNKQYHDQFGVYSGCFALVSYEVLLYRWVGKL